MARYQKRWNEGSVPVTQTKEVSEYGARVAGRVHAGMGWTEDDLKKQVVPSLWNVAIEAYENRLSQKCGF